MKTIIEMAREAEDKVIANPDLDWKREFAALVRADEREACAKVCESQAGPELDFPDERSNAQDAMAFECAAAIRARGENT